MKMNPVFFVILLTILVLSPSYFVSYERSHYIQMIIKNYIILLGQHQYKLSMWTISKQKLTGNLIILRYFISKNVEYVPFYQIYRSQSWGVKQQCKLFFIYFWCFSKNFHKVFCIYFWYFSTLQRPTLELDMESKIKLGLGYIFSKK